MDTPEQTPIAPVTPKPSTTAANTGDTAKQIRKYRRNGVIWLIVPFVLLITILIGYAVAQFTVSSLLQSQPALPSSPSSDLGLDYATNIGLGVSTPADSVVSIINVVMGLLGVLAVILIPLGIIFAVINFSKAGKATLTTFDPRSGKGPASEIPAEIKGWSWGAVGLNWIWGVYHGVWLSLLIFVPIVNYVWWIVMGIKGREWAWSAMQWESVAAFNASQKKWDIWGAIFFFLPLIVGAAFMVILFSK